MQHCFSASVFGHGCAIKIKAKINKKIKADRIITKILILLKE